MSPSNAMGNSKRRNWRLTDCLIVGGHAVDRYGLWCGAKVGEGGEG